MKIKKIILCALLCCINFLGFCQTQWTKYESNPILIKQNFITEFYSIGQPTVIIENDTIKMWYVAAGLPYITSRLMYAWSVDGINWTKYLFGASVMNPGTSPAWDVWMDTPEVIHDDEGYKLYYYGDTVASEGNMPSSHVSMGMATSTNGINWVKYANNPILTHGNLGDWDQHWIESPAVLYDSETGNYKMWFSGVDTLSWKIQIGLATSEDGYNWTKYEGNPVLSFGAEGEHDDMWVATPGVIKKDDHYEMWYSTFSSLTGFSKLHIAFATSNDGISWNKHLDNPLFDTYTEPYDSIVDSRGPWACDVIFDNANSEYMMWYETAAGFCLATAPENSNKIEKTNKDISNLYIFPNPVCTYSTIMTGSLLNNAELKIIDLEGRTISQIKGICGSELRLEKGDLLPGVYLLRLINGTETFESKISIQ